MILFLTPPLTQLNTPYAATPALMGWMARLGVEATQRDLSLEVALEVLHRYGPQPLTARVIAFLQGKCPDDAEEIAEPGFLPEGTHFRALEHMGYVDDATERAKIRCALYLDDLAAQIRRDVDPDFGFSRYAEHLGVAVPDFGAILRRLRRRSPVDRILEEKVAAAVREVWGKTRPKARLRPIVSVTCPFPGTLLGAFRIARTVRRLLPGALLVLGGGYVNTELRLLNDRRVKRFFDEVMFDEGYGPWRDLLLREGHAPKGAKPAAWHARVPPFVKPSYRDLDLTSYIDLAETVNPMQRLWSDGRWLKMQLARGCYWHKCAFCDVTLDYIRHFQMTSVDEIVTAMEALARETAYARRADEVPSFHFTDEALPPALVDRLAREILHRAFRCRWWGNVRFDASWTPRRCRLIARAGCCAVSGGLECADDRLLKLMNKGITCASAAAALRHFSAAGILTHAYLMYGFPTQRVSELKRALGYVRDRFREGTLHSAFFHRFALTVHSPIARDPAHFNLTLAPSAAARTVRFAVNEIPFVEKGAPDWRAYRRPLEAALYNYMLGLGLGRSVAFWFKAFAERSG